MFFTVCFGALSRLFTRVEIVRVRRKSRLELAAQQEKARDDMRLFRLVAPSSDGVRDEDRLAVFDTATFEQVTTIEADKPSGIFLSVRAHQTGL